MIKGWDISEGIFNLAKTKPNLHFLLEKIHKEQWFGSIFWEWDQIESTFWDYPTFNLSALLVYFFYLVSVKSC